MSSGSKQDFDMSRAIVANAPLDQAGQRIARLGLSPRQQALMHLWAHYRCERYAARRVDWDGSPYEDPVAIEAVASQTDIPPGFVDLGEQWPLKYRRPDVVYNLVKVVVDRFTGMLFSERHHPKVRVEGDPDTQDYIQALVEASGLWPEMMQARTYGGAMGLTYVGFKFVDGSPDVEVHNPIWVFPQFNDRAKLKLRSIEIRYQYPQEELDEDGIPINVWYWYRRTITETHDTLFAPAHVGEGDEPLWKIAAEVEHGFGFCPVVLIQNMPMQEDIEGDPDAHGIYENTDSINKLLSEAKKGTILNCDPTVVLKGGEKVGEIRKGSDNALEVGPEGDAKYMESTGSGAKAAREFSRELRELSLEVVQCVLENPNKSFQTATEVERVYAAMLAKVDRLREQYGQRGVVPLIKMMVRACQILESKRTKDPITGAIIRQVVNLPPRYEKQASGKFLAIPRKLGPGGLVQLQWPKYFDPGAQEALTATQAAVSGLAGGVIDREAAAEYVAEYYGVEDVPAMLQRLESNEAEKGAAMDRALLGKMNLPNKPTTNAALNGYHNPEELQ